jgi:hypothetical protein
MDTNKNQFNRAVRIGLILLDDKEKFPAGECDMEIEDFNDAANCGMTAVRSFTQKWDDDLNYYDVRAAIIKTYHMIHV